MAEFAAGYTHLEAVSCSLLARSYWCLEDNVTHGLLRCGIVPEGDLEAGEGERFEGERENRAFGEQPNQDVELAGEDEVGVELLQVVVDFA